MNATENVVFLRKMDAAELVESLKAWAVAGASPVLTRGADGHVCVAWGGLSRVIADCLRPSETKWIALLGWLRSEESEPGVDKVLNFFFPTSEDKDDYVSRIWRIHDALKLEGEHLMNGFVRRVLILEAIAESLHQGEMKRA